MSTFDVEFAPTCGCEHFDHDDGGIGHPYGAVPAPRYSAREVGPVCARCARTHVGETAKKSADLSGAEVELSQLIVDSTDISVGVGEGMPDPSLSSISESEGQARIIESVDDSRDWGIVICALMTWSESFDDPTDPSARRALELAEQAMTGTGIFAGFREVNL